jgi:hypothetical protein
MAKYVGGKEPSKGAMKRAKLQATGAKNNLRGTGALNRKLAGIGEG